MVPEVGLEPTRDYSHQILSLAHLVQIYIFVVALLLLFPFQALY
jgi:hypothetical protein